MDATDLAFTPALQLAQLIRQKVISPRELTQIYLDRIERFNPQLGSYFYVAAQLAMKDAIAKTEQLVQSDPQCLPPLFGVPISIKDLNPVADMPLTCGLKVLKGNIAQGDDGVVRRIRQAGLVILGKTAIPQIATLPYTEPPGFPPARNPWNLDYTPGGSSGGGAAALAAGLCALSQGSDGGGSLRGPAFCCGLVGFKPSRGVISCAPAGELLAGLATNGPLGSTVADTAALTDVMAGYEIGDPYWRELTNLTAIAQNPAPLTALRIGMAHAIPPVGSADANCQAALHLAGQRLEALGHHVEPFDFPDLTPMIAPFTVVYQSIFREAQVPPFVLEKINRWFYWRSLRTSTGHYLRSLKQLQTFARQLLLQLQAWDVLLLPVYTAPAIPIGAWTKLSSAQIFQEIINWIAPCPVFNVSGQPAIALPTGFTAAGLPVGVQLVGKIGQDAQLIQLAAHLEGAIACPKLRPALVIPHA
jgi:amidase